MAYNPGFTGGQCITRYRVTGTGTFEETDMSPGTTRCTGTFEWEANSVQGPLTVPFPSPNGWFVDVTPSGIAVVFFEPEGANLGAGVGVSRNYQYSCEIGDGYGQVAVAKTISITGVFRLDGQPDNCGNLNPIEHPSNSPCSLPDGSCSPATSY
jgi:hypothetical protein